MGGPSRLIAAFLLIVAQGLLQAQPREPDFGTLSLDQLTERAAAIVVSTVTSRRAEWEHFGASRLIITKVTIEVEQSLKGSAPRTLTVDVLGGTIGDETLRVSHVPEFRVGDRDVLFLNNAPHAVSPLVGSDQGRFRVMNEAGSGTARMLTVGFAPLVSVEAIGLATSAQGGGGLVRSMSAALSLSDFVTLVRDRVRQLERRR
ncbi:MAG: hypothetical protein WC815_07235 [Vicinamibacterales bacterium]|jgi:hypothetical protein